MIKGKSVIIVVVDKLSKFYHLGALPTEFTAKMEATFFVENVIKLYGVPSSILSDRDKVFTSSFWRELN